ncbi:ubiquitin carboxyl-terminal hydrolase 47-like [Dysidea avara]|uniref:ubiquitin carboxyl-terminal hydrolase 47-like n=1 Tax=Dysidea avara TaxID=196820 RepID=UPI00331663F6
MAAERSVQGFVGLLNQGSSAYVNTVVQMLYMTPEFRNAVCRWQYLETCSVRDCRQFGKKNKCNHAETKEKCILYQLQQLFLKLQTVHKVAVDTYGLTRSFGWSNREGALQQHDVSEILRVLLDAVEKKFGFNKDIENLLNLYKGEMKDFVKCLKCGNVSVRADSFRNLPLIIKPHESNITYNNVTDSLNAFIQPEICKGYKQHFCKTCGKKCDTHKELKITKLPYVLTLQLNRFSFDYDTMHRIKINNKMSFPKILDVNFLCGHHPDSLSTVVQDFAVANDSNDDNFLYEAQQCTSNAPYSISDDSGFAIINDSNENITPEIASQECSQISCSNAGCPEDELSEEDLVKAAFKSGKNVYELFSIMVHSGNAFGGHYFAYIKSFTDKKWYCFDDDCVTLATDDDIKNTFGDDKLDSSSISSNAYVLTYRLIDSTRNADFITKDAFPLHLYHQLEECFRSEKECEDWLCKFTLYSIHPTTKDFVQDYFAVHKDMLFKEATKIAYQLLRYNGVVPLEQCRLVTYDDKTNTIKQSFDGQESRRFGQVVGGFRQFYNFNLFLEVRGKNSL